MFYAFYDTTSSFRQARSLYQLILENAKNPGSQEFLLFSKADLRIMQKSNIDIDEN